MSSDGIKLGLMRFVMVSRVLWFQRSEERCFLSKNHSWKHITIVPTKSTNKCYIVLLKYTPSWVSTCQMCFPGTPPNLPEVMATSPLPLGNHLSCLVKFGVSIHGNNPKWTVYSGKTINGIKIDDLGVPPFQETFRNGFIVLYSRSNELLISRISFSDFSGILHLRPHLNLAFFPQVECSPTSGGRTRQPNTGCPGNTSRAVNACV